VRDQDTNYSDSNSRRIILSFQVPRYSPCFPLLPVDIHPWYWLLSLLQQGWPSPLPGHSHRALHWPASRLHPPTLHAPLVLQLWHECPNHRSMDAVEHAVQHAEGLTINSKTCPQHHCPALQPASAASKWHHNPFPPSCPHASHALELVHNDLSRV